MQTGLYSPINQSHAAKSFAEKESFIPIFLQNPRGLAAPGNFSPDLPWEALGQTLFAYLILMEISPRPKYPRSDQAAETSAAPGLSGSRQTRLWDRECSDITISGGNRHA